MDKLDIPLLLISIICFLSAVFLGIKIFSYTYIMPLDWTCTEIDRTNYNLNMQQCIQYTKKEVLNNQNN